MKLLIIIKHGVEFTYLRVVGGIASEFRNSIK